VRDHSRRRRRRRSSCRNDTWYNNIIQYYYYYNCCTRRSYKSISERYDRQGSEKCEHNIMTKRVQWCVLHLYHKTMNRCFKNSMCLPVVATKAPWPCHLREIGSSQRVARCATNNAQRALSGRTARRRARKSRAPVSRALLKSRPTEKWKTKRIAPTNLQKVHRCRTSAIV